MKAALRAGVSFLDFLRWWQGELQALLPERAPRSQLIVSVNDDGITLESASGARHVDRVDGEDRSARLSRIEAFLTAHLRQIQGMPIIIRVSSELTLVRTFHIPSAAREDAQRLALLDLERTTPLDSHSVLSVAVPLSIGEGAQMQRIRQIIVKRDALADAHALLQRHGLVASRIECLDDRGDVLPHDFLASYGSTTSHRVWRGLGLHVAIAACLATISTMVLFARFDSLEASIRTQIDSERRKLAAASTGQTDARISAAREVALGAWLSAQPLRALLLESLSQLLPDTVFLTSLQIEGGDVSISGFSASAAELVPLIERSGILKGAVLTGPTVLDPRSGRERFSLRARTVGASASGALKQ